MKKRMISVPIIMILLSLVFCACSKKDESAKDLWSDALYTADTEFGNGDKLITVTVKANEKSVVFTIRTDDEFLGDALTQHKLIEGEKGAYGLYVKKVNGITADYDIDESYWSLTKNGEYMNSGVDTTKIQNGEKYEFTYTK